MKKGFFPEILNSSEVPEQVKEFILRIVPEKYQKGKLISDRGRLLINDEYMIPNDIIKKDPFFKTFRVNN